MKNFSIRPTVKELAEMMKPTRERCPACGGDRIEVQHDSRVYCADCGRVTGCAHSPVVACADCESTCKQERRKSK